MTRFPRRASVMDVDTSALIRQFGATRTEIGRVRMQVPLRSPSYAALGTLLAQIDEMVGLLTGQQDYFAGKAHSGRFKDAT